MEMLFKVLTLSGSASAVLSGIICYMAYRLVRLEQAEREKDAAERKHLADKIELLEKDKLADLKQRLENHLQQDQSQKILTMLESMEKTAAEHRKQINGRLESLSTQVSRALETTEGHTQLIKSNRQYIDNLREDMQRQAAAGSTNRP